MEPNTRSPFAKGLLLLLAGLTASSSSTAQNARYKLIDIGTLGGPSAYGALIGPGSQLLNNAGTVAGTADTSTLDPDCGCFVSLGLAVVFPA